MLYYFNEWFDDVDCLLISYKQWFHFSGWFIYIFFYFFINNAVLFQWMISLLSGQCGLPFDFFIINAVLFQWMVYLLSGLDGLPVQ